MQNRIRELRVSLGLTQREFGKRIFLSGSKISALENEIDKLIREIVHNICKEFKVTKAYVIGERVYLYTIHSSTEIHGVIIGDLSDAYKLVREKRSTLSKLTNEDIFITKYDYDESNKYWLSERIDTWTYRDLMLKFDPPFIDYK